MVGDVIDAFTSYFGPPPEHQKAIREFRMTRTVLPAGKMIHL
jgi:hypothetical protein